MLIYLEYMLIKGMSPVYIKLYLFNVTNPHEILDGKKPEVQEVGPYVYL
jgi:hypothetical protein